MTEKSLPASVSGLKAIGLTLILGVLALDQASKYWVVNILRLPEIGKIEISSLFDLTMLRNYGISFGAFTADADWERWALVGLSGVIATIFAVWLTRAKRGLTILALALVIGGAVGNMIDRVRFGYVVDFFDFSGMYFPWVFNVADSAITLGAILLAIDMLLNPDEPPQSRPKDVVNPDDPSTTA
jgi:signal peptidase II